MQFVLLLIGIFSCSTSVIFIKLSSTDPVALSSYRLLLAAACMAPIALRKWNRLSSKPGLRRLLKQTLPPAVLLAIHFVSWIAGARMTPAANASLLVNMVPVVMPFFLFAALRERLTPPERRGTALAMSGILFLGVADFNLSPEYALGDAVCFLSMLFYANYLLFARIHKEIPSIYLYVVPVYAIAGFLCLTVALLMEWARPETVIWLGPDLSTEAVAIVGLALVPTVLGHSIINNALKSIGGQTVVILNLTQFIFAGFMALLIFGEKPHLSFLLASSLIMAGAILVIHGGKR